MTRAANPIAVTVPMDGPSLTKAVAIRVMSGAAIEPGLLAAIDAFHKQTGINVAISFATAPDIQRRVSGGETPDVVITTPAVLDDLTQSGRIVGTARAPVGRVGVGVAVRDGAPTPDISTTNALKRALLDADFVIYNRASSGLYVEALIRRLGLTERIQGKTKRYSGTDMVEPLIGGSGKEIGFMPVAEILHFRSKGMRLVGPLPPEIQHYTHYIAARLSKSEAALAFIQFLTTSAAKSLFAAAGIE